MHVFRIRAAKFIRRAKKTVEGGANKRRPEIPTPNDRIGTISKNQGRDIEKQLKWVLNLVHH